MRVHEQDISVELDKDELFWDVEAFWRHTRVGYCWCEQRGDRLYISDLKVESEHLTHWPFLCHLPVISRFACSKIDFRHRGIGSRLINRIISEAAAAGVREVWGSVTQSDIDQTPFLLQWYERMGFVVSEPDHECVATAAKKITKQMLSDA